MMDDVAFLEELVAIPSLSGEEQALAEHLCARMASIGFRVRRDEVGNVIGEVGDPTAERTIVLLGHMDTVPGDVPVRRQSGFVYGRGAVDAKGPLAVFVLAAARAVRELRAIRLTVIGAVEEEACSRGAHHLGRTMKPPEGAVIGEPSGWDGITLGYKGTLRVDYRLTRAAGHGAGERTTPAEDAVAFWNQMARYAAVHNGDRRPPRFDTLDPSLRSISSGSDGLEDWIEMGIGLRLPLGIDIAALRQRIRAWGDGAEVSFPYGERAFRAEKNTPVVRALLRAVRAEGGRPRFKLKTGTSDMNVVGPAWGCPIVAYGPGDSSLDHTPGERIAVDEFRRGVDVLTYALTAL